VACNSNTVIDIVCHTMCRNVKEAIREESETKGERVRQCVPKTPVVPLGYRSSSCVKLHFHGTILPVKGMQMP
jgi:hypothetical protein